MMAKILFDTDEYRNLCPGNDAINKPEKEYEYNPLEDTGMGTSNKIPEKDNVDDLVNQYHDQQYHDTKKDNDQKGGAVYDQPPDYTDAATGSISAPIEGNKSADKTNGCSGNYQEAYKQYMTAYNQLTTLMAQGKGNTPEGQSAYKISNFYKDCLSLLEAPPAPADHEIDTGVSNTPTRKCADNAKDAYQQYLPAYNKITQLMQQSEGDTPRTQRAYENYKFYKDCYEAFTKTLPTH